MGEILKILKLNKSSVGGSISGLKVKKKSCDIQAQA